MTSRLGSRFLALWTILVLLSPIILGTEPTPPPYHQLIVRGQVQRPGGGSLKSFVVTLVGRFSVFPPDTVREITDGLVVSPSTAIYGVTDTAGDFYVDLKCGLKPDSLALKVTGVDRPEFVGAFFGLPPAIPILETREGHSSGCEGCETVEPTQTVTVGYQYQLPDQTIVIPY